MVEYQVDPPSTVELIHQAAFRLGVLDHWMASINERLDKIEEAVYPLGEGLAAYLRYNSFFKTEEEARLAHALLNIALRGMDKDKWREFPEDQRVRHVERFMERLTKGLGDSAPMTVNRGVMEL